jgi:hypothetical protein
LVVLITRKLAKGEAGDVEGLQEWIHYLSKGPFPDV